jgi:hypothetical protein
VASKPAYLTGPRLLASVLISACKDVRIAGVASVASSLVCHADMTGGLPTVRRAGMTGGLPTVRRAGMTGRLVAGVTSGLITSVASGLVAGVASRLVAGPASVAGRAAIGPAGVVSWTKALSTTGPAPAGLVGCTAERLRWTLDADGRW